MRLVAGLRFLGPLGRMVTRRPGISRSWSQSAIARLKPGYSCSIHVENGHPAWQTLDDFPRRHIGPDQASIQNMLNALSPPASSMDELVQQVIPKDILRPRSVFPVNQSPTDGATKEGLREWEVQHVAELFAQKNAPRKSCIGAGYYETIVPSVIERNVLESPAWYTSYTPYQPELSQGRLESLVNFQTMVCDLTGLPIANASLLDEGTAAAEAMTLSMNMLPASKASKPGKVYVVSDLVHPQTISVLRSRAEGFGIRIETADLSHGDLSKVEELAGNLVGVLVQYPDTYGLICDFGRLAERVHQEGALLSVATDLLALTRLAPPGEWGADIAVGSSQRFGVPPGFGGPHAAFFAVTSKLKRKLPGRLVGLSKDRLGRPAYRLALQTREQHIRREKATSNVCTAQALLANMSALYAVYHGPEGLKAIADRCNRGARVIQQAALACGYKVASHDGDQKRPVPFDTVVIQCLGQADSIVKSAHARGIYIRHISPDMVGISIDEMTRETHLDALIQALQFPTECPSPTTNSFSLTDAVTMSPDGQDVGSKKSVISAAELLEKMSQNDDLPEYCRRKSTYLTHPVFNTHHSETELLRYIHHLESKDLSLVHSMIPLGSCTMKLNSTVEMMTIRPFLAMHPHAPTRDAAGYLQLISCLEDQLKRITAMDGVSLQPNSGAQGEFAGLRTIRKYLASQGQGHRDICLIPVSAHGTNPASAAMAGMRVLPIKCDAKTGNLDLSDLEAKLQQHSHEIAAIMITYPSTFGVFEPGVKHVCELVHQHGGQVYLDGANMNAQIGLCSPGEIGADVCHLNLHKTFCIPHGGGGPGVGPICVRSHLAPYLPSRNVFDQDKPTHPVSSAPYGSASILPISWAYNSLMGSDGLKQATMVTLLNANYLLARLKPHYKILYTNNHGRCAHEFILDVRPFRDTADVEAIDIAKRLQDYGFHAPTMSWPVANTLMIEPTESESLEELDRFVDALLSIREEIREIEEGRAPRKGNLLKMAPHPVQDIVDGDTDGKWDRPYSRDRAVYPLPWLREKKFWPSVARVDDTYGDTNLFCTCSPVEDTTTSR